MTGIDDIGPEQFGTATRTGDGFELDFARDYLYPHDLVWRSVTDPERARLWWAETRVDPRVGGEFAVRWLNGRDGEPLEWLDGEILAIDEGRSIQFSNSDHGLLRWEVTPTPSGTRLRFTAQTTPAEERFVAMSLAGWHIHLDHLAQVLAGGTIDWSTWYAEYEPAWTALHEHYRGATGLQ